jgi:CRP-like cAMP-binding protein
MSTTHISVYETRCQRAVSLDTALPEQPLLAAASTGSDTKDRHVGNSADSRGGSPPPPTNTTTTDSTTTTPASDGTVPKTIPRWDPRAWMKPNRAGDHASPGTGSSPLVKRGPTTDQEPGKKENGPLIALRRQLSSVGSNDAAKLTPRSQTEMEEQMKRKVVSIHKQEVPKGMILCNSKIRIIWDFVTIIWILYITFQVPFIVAFDVNIAKSPGAFAMDVVINIFFLLDIVLNFRTGFYDGQRTIEETDPWKVAKNYLKGWFLMDVIATVPWGELLGDGVHSKALRLTKLVRLIKVPIFLETVDNHITISKAGLTIAFLVVAIVCMAHWAACLFFFISVLSFDDESEDAARLPDWMPEHVESHEVLRQYVNSFYWSVTTLTTVGYGDITPKNDTERLAASFIMLMGGSFYGYGIALMAQLVSKLDLNKQNFETKLDQVKAYMVSRHLPRDLQLRVKQYYKHYMTQKSAMNEKEVLGELSTLLQHEVSGHLVNHIVYKIPIFMGRDPHLISQLVHIMKPCTCAPGDTIITAGEVGRDMYMIISGKLSVYGTKDEFLGTLSDEDSFGELSALGVTQKRLTTIRADTYCEMISLSREDLMDAFSKSPDTINAMKDLARQNRYYKLGNAKRKVSLVKKMSSNNGFMGAVKAKSASKQVLSPGRSSPGRLSPRLSPRSSSKVVAAPSQNPPPLSLAEKGTSDKSGNAVQKLATPIAARPRVVEEAKIMEGIKDCLPPNSNAVDLSAKLRMDFGEMEMESITEKSQVTSPMVRRKFSESPPTTPSEINVNGAGIPKSGLKGLARCDTRQRMGSTLCDTSALDEAIAEMLNDFTAARKREDLVLEKVALLQKHNSVLRKQLHHLGHEPHV